MDRKWAHGRVRKNGFAKCRLDTSGSPQNPGITDIRRLLSSSPPLVAVAKETIQQREDVMNPPTWKIRLGVFSGQSLGWWMINCVSLAPLRLSNYLAWFIGGHSCITRCHISTVWNYESKHINWDRVHFSDRLCTFELQKCPKSCVKTILNVFSHSLLAAYFNWKMVSPRNVDW